MPDPAITDLRRDLAKARDVLEAAQTHLAAHAEANAALHCATAVMYSPLHARITAAIAGISQALARPTLSTENGRLAAVLLDLDRCAHGRHQGDVCADCNGPSRGNHHMPPGHVIGYDRHGESIVVPERKFRHSAEAWRTAVPTDAIPEA